MPDHNQFWFYLFLVPFLLLAGCTIFSPVPSHSTKTYVLNADPQPITKKSKRSIDLFITPTRAEAGYNTADMVYTNKPLEMAYFANHAWAEPPATLLPNLIRQTLQKTHYYHSVNSAFLIGHADMILNTELVKLNQDFLSHPSTVNLILQAQLVNANTNRIMSTKQFSFTEPALQATPEAGVVAANQAVEKLLLQLAEFCLKNS